MEDSLSRRNPLIHDTVYISLMRNSVRPSPIEAQQSACPLWSQCGPIHLPTLWRWEWNGSHVGGFPGTVHYALYLASFVREIYILSCQESKITRLTRGGRGRPKVTVSRSRWVIRHRSYTPSLSKSFLNSKRILEFLMLLDAVWLRIWPPPHDGILVFHVFIWWETS